jgi:hypothetical protein
MAKSSKSNEIKPTHQQIAERARQIYEESGRIPGRDLENWYAAEAQLAGNINRPAMVRPQVKGSQTSASRSVL